VTWLLGLFGGSTIGLWIAAGLLALGVGAWGTQTWRLHSAETELAEASSMWAKREAELSQRALEDHR
jgi:hypothetical protein